MALFRASNLYKLFLALRYLRKRPISILSVLGVWFGVWALLVVSSVMGGFARDLRARIRGMTAHITVSASRSKLASLENWEEIARQVQAAAPDQVVATAPQLEWPIMISRGPKPALLVGIIPERERQVSGFSNHILDGHPADFSDPSGRALPEGWGPCIMGAGILDRYTNKDVVFICDGDGAIASLDDLIPVVNPKDKLAVVLADGSASGGLVQGDEERENRPIRSWLKGRKDGAVKDWVRVFEAALRLVAYDLKGETRPSRIAVVSQGQVPSSSIRDAWNRLAPKERALIEVMAPGLQTLREPGQEGARNVSAFRLPTGPEARPEFVDRVKPPFVGQWVKITTISPEDARNSGIASLEPTHANLAIVGAFNSGMNEYDTQIIYAPLEFVQEALRECKVDDKGNPVLDANGKPVEGRINRLRVKIKDYDNATEIAAKISKALKGRYLVTTWQEEKEVLLQAVAMERTLTGLIIFIIIIVAAFLIWATLSMLVTEKTRDIGILRAQGATVAGVTSIFITEGLILGGLGCGGGVLTAKLFLDRINPIADWMYEKTGWYPFPKNIYLLDRIPHHVEPLLWTAVVCATIVVCFFATLYPAFRVSRMNPIEALRYE